MFEAIEVAAVDQENQSICSFLANVFKATFCEFVKALLLE